jgi:hypothetical protein
LTKPLSQAELKEKRLQALTRLACQILDGKVVDKPRREAHTNTGYLLLRFLVKPLPDNWGEAAEVFRPDPGDCENCPACLKWPGNNGTHYCFYDAYFVGLSGKTIEATKNNCRLKPQD